MIALVVAISENNAIGKNNELLWHLPADLKHFKSITTGHPIIMGRKTFESIGKPLPNRTSIIVTHKKNYTQEGCIVVPDIERALLAAKEIDETICIIGGGEIYKQTIGLADTLFLTRVHQTFQADTFFPEIDLNKWQEVERKDFDADDKNEFAYSFITLKRKPHTL